MLDRLLNVLSIKMFEFLELFRVSCFGFRILTLRCLGSIIPKFRNANQESKIKILKFIYLLFFNKLRAMISL